MLDRLPTWARDLFIALVAATVGWVSSDAVPLLRDQGGLAAVGAACLVVLANAVTPWLTRAYGAGRTSSTE